VSIGRKLRVVPRAPGDTTPLDPAVAEALRKAGMDPAKFSVAPGDALAGIPTPGTRLAHRFHFARLNDAFDAMQRMLDGATSARIGKDGDGWLVTFESPEDPKIDDGAEHERVAALAKPFGGEDEGFGRETIAVNVRHLGK
jgi:hypothetical protein